MPVQKGEGRALAGTASFVDRDSKLAKLLENLA
jgi:hypothetical protein